MVIDSSDLVLGWRVNRGLDPEFWLGHAAAVGQHSEGHVVRVPPSGMEAHIAIVAQSGSGKSFFLGRIIEELALNTKARCLILDPNGDYLQIGDLAPQDLWNLAGYDHKSRRGFLPTELYKEAQDLWAKIVDGIRIRSNYPVPAAQAARLSCPGLP
jgi:hypothetical protein